MRNTSVEQLLDRMRQGDRDASAEFITCYGTRIRRRVRGKLSTGMRRVYDSQEILSTVGRRLDRYVNDGRLQAANEKQFWTLVLTMAEHAIVDKARIFQRLHQVEGQDGEFARLMLGRMNDANRLNGDGVRFEIEQAMDVLEDVVDRDILYLWLNDTTLAEISRVVDLQASAVRKRWKRIKDRLRPILERKSEQ